MNDKINDSYEETLTAFTKAIFSLNNSEVELVIEQLIKKFDELLEEVKEANS